MTGQYASWTNPAGFNSDLADVNEDGLIDMTDVDLIMKHYVGLVPALPARPEPPAPTCGEGCGDVNGDGKVNTTDALLVTRYYQGLDVPGFNASVADVNEDGAIDGTDATFIMQYYAGLIDALPWHGSPAE
ncbi:MAG: hypothetical protein JXB30_18935, partial [Anaerolineae bacterium]|nr:hypothetical protein [Anaerolineae bacterium]